jgi:type IV secretion system protein VirB11
MPAMQAENLIGTVAAMLGTVVNASAPIVEGELPLDGNRFEGILPPVSTAPVFVIRKRPSALYTLEDYVRAEILDAAQAEFLRAAVRARQNLVIAGGTTSGKTTLANALIAEMVRLGDPAQRIVILEDTRELQCTARNAVQLHTGDVADLTRLTRVTMRLRPDRIIIGEVRGGEALALLKAWNTGHPGGVTTIHANSAMAALMRLDSLIQEAGVPPQPRLVAEAVNLVVFIARTPEGRRVRELATVAGYDPAAGSYTLAPMTSAP